MRRWAAQHPPGTVLPIRYDPEHHDRIVPDAGAMPESEPHVPNDLKSAFLLFVLAVACKIVS